MVSEHCVACRICNPRIGQKPLDNRSCLIPKLIYKNKSCKLFPQPFWFQLYISSISTWWKNLPHGQRFYHVPRTSILDVTKDKWDKEILLKIWRLRKHNLEGAILTFEVFVTKSFPKETMISCKKNQPRRMERSQVNHIDVPPYIVKFNTPTYVV